MTFFSSSYSTSTKAPPMPLSTLDHAPLKKALPPSSRAILRQQSIVPVYMISAGEGKNSVLGCKGEELWEKDFDRRKSHLLYDRTASSYAYGQCRRGTRSGRQQPWPSVRSSSSPGCGCSWGQEACLSDNPQHRLKTFLSTNRGCCFSVKNAPLAVS